MRERDSRETIRVGSPPAKPLVAYDGRCAFCQRWVGRLKAITGGRIDYEPSQQLAPRFPEILPQAFERSVQLIEPNGAVTEGAHAIARILSLAGKKRWALWAYEHLPRPAKAAEAAYHWVATHRDTADVLDRWLLPGDDPKRSYRVARSTFLRALGVVYLCAFLSLWVQIDGLIGSRGILPARHFLADVRGSLEGVSAVGRFVRLPTLCWINDSDASLHFLCGGGASLACLLIFGLLPVPVLFLLWFFYLSLTNIGQEFLGYQWDALLLEAGFLTIFFAPLQWRLRADNPRPSRVVLLLLRWLLFRLMFMSGAVKLLSGDATWRGWTAMKYHYFTQPLPTWTSWYMHLMPDWFQSMSVGVTFFVELLVPFLFFGSRRVRQFAFLATLLFQLLIAGTGNYGFFNLLGIALCMPLLDDAAWGWVLRRKTAVAPAAAGWRWPIWITGALVILMLLLSAPILLALAGAESPASVAELRHEFAPFMVNNSYGLFAIMTTQRPEIIIEGSDDGTNWKQYEFKWKPGEVTRRPRFCAPHMPRLDWQMWFAALDLLRGREDQWVWAFLQRLREGDDTVLRLLANNPFPDRPPTYLRAMVYDYRFADWQTHRRTGAWWERRLIGMWGEPMGPSR